MTTYIKFKLYIPFYLMLILWTVPCEAQLDNTFGSGGKVIVPIGNGWDYISGILISNEKIILTGYYSNSGNYDFTAVQLNNDGSKDLSFGTNGIVNVDVGFQYEGAYASKLSADGKIVVAGYSYNGSNSDFTCIRLSNNGVLDNTFDADGKDSVAFGNTSIEESYAVMGIDTDKLLLLGTTSDGSNDDFALAKLNTDGSYDLTFNSTGKFTYSIDAGDVGNSLGIQSNGKIIIGGYSSNGFLAIRVNINGTLDNTFGTNGYKLIPMELGDEVRSMTIQADDKIVLIGKSGFDMVAVRLNTDGSIDSGFGTNGIVTITEGTTSLCNSVAIDQNNKIVLAGYTFNGSRSDVFVVRLNPEGTEDSRSIISVGIGNSAGKSVLIDANNKIVIGCSAIEDGTDEDFAVIRLDDMFVTETLASTDISTTLTLFPNPATQNLTINSTYTIQQIKVLDVLGKEVMNLNNTGNTMVDISTLPKGLYNFVITTDRGVGSKKVSVQ